MTFRVSLMIMMGLNWVSEESQWLPHYNVCIQRTVIIYTEKNRNVTNTFAKIFDLKQLFSITVTYLSNLSEIKQPFTLNAFRVPSFIGELSNIG